MDIISFTIPFPPSVNGLYSNARNGRRLTARGRIFYTEACLKLKYQCMPLPVEFPITKSVQLFIDIYPPDNRIRDESNLRKAIDDSLEKSGILANDFQIKRSCSQMHKKSKRSYVTLKIALLESYSLIDFIKKCTKSEKE